MSERTQSTASERERAILVGAERPKSALPADESLAELGRLAETAGVTVAGQTLQPLRRIHPATFVGIGKVQEVKRLADEANAGVVIFDDPLSPAQQRNLEKTTGRKVVDRSALILDIFAQRARSLEGRMQVELAQLQYLLPRLTRAWTHLSRLRGGVGTRGPGETQLEVDRRRVRERIAQLRRRLRDVERTRGLHRSERASVPFPTVALVGYTNAGKSTLMNALTRAGVFVEDRLFATLDPTVRRIRLPKGGNVLVADTVGFIHKLPHQLVEAFKSTLEEVRDASLLVHVIDVSHPHWPAQEAVVRDVLEEIGAGGLPTVRAMNKIDALAPDERPARGPESVPLSARTGAGLPHLLGAIETVLTGDLERVRARFPPDAATWSPGSGGRSHPRRALRGRGGAGDGPRAAQDRRPAPQARGGRGGPVLTVFNIPNFLTLLRIVAIPFFLILLEDGKYAQAFAVFVGAGDHRRPRWRHRAAHPHQDDARRLPRPGRRQAAAGVGLHRPRLHARRAALAGGGGHHARRDHRPRLLPPLHADPRNDGGAPERDGQGEHGVPALRRSLVLVSLAWPGVLHPQVKEAVFYMTGVVSGRGGVAVHVSRARVAPAPARGGVRRTGRSAAPGVKPVYPPRACRAS